MPWTTILDWTDDGHKIQRSSDGTIAVWWYRPLNAAVPGKVYRLTYHTPEGQMITVDADRVVEAKRRMAKARERAREAIK